MIFPKTWYVIRNNDLNKYTNWRIFFGVETSHFMQNLALNLVLHAVYVNHFSCDASGRQDVSSHSLECSPWKRLKQVS